MKLIYLVAAMASACSSMIAADAFTGYCENGGQPVVVSSINSTTLVQQSFPSCDVAVYIHGLAVVSGTYTSGGTITGTTSETCTVTFIGGTQGYGTVALTSTNTIAGGTALTIVNGGQGFATAPTAATLTSGTASCSGTAAIATALGAPVLAAIYSDNFQTALSNPFTSNANGSYQFYAADGRYDIVFYGSSIPGTITDFDEQLLDWLWQPPGGLTPSSGTQPRPFKYKMSDIVNVRDYGARDDGLTDNSNAIQAALSDAQEGQTVYFPCTPSALWTSTGVYAVTHQLLVPSGITLRGDDWRHCFLEQNGASTSQMSVLNLIGSDSVTITGLKVFAAGATNMPATVLALGRYPSTSAAGHHTFYNTSFSGNVTGAVVYSIGSEENSWDSVEIEANNGASSAGTALYGFYTATNDALGICSPACSTSTNLSLWHHAVHIANFGTAKPFNCVYDLMDQTAGDHVYRDGYCAVNGSGQSGYGYGFHFVADPVNPFSGFNYWVQNERVENGDGLALLDTGARSGGGFLTSIHLIGNTTSGGVTHIYFANSTSHVTQSEFISNLTVAGGNPSAELDSCDDDYFWETFTGNLKFDTIITNSSIIYSGNDGNFTLTIPNGSYQNWVQGYSTVSANGPVVLAPVASSLTNEAPLLFPCNATPGTISAGSMWCDPSTKRLHWYDSSTETLAELGVDAISNWPAAANPGIHEDTYGRLAVTGGPAGFSVSSCGTSPVAAGGNDNVLLFIAGTGTANSCTITFAHAWTSGFNPVCVASFQTGAIPSVLQVATNTTTAVITPYPSANMAGQALQMLCFGHN